MIRVAQIMGKMECGGVEAVVMNYYRHINRENIQFDFFVDQDSSCPQKTEIVSLGGRVYHIPPYQKIFANMRDLKALFLENRYSIVHAQLTTMSVFSLKVAKDCGVPVRICHGHNTAAPGEWKKNILKYSLRPFAKTYATHCFACSRLAGQWLFGKDILSSPRYCFVPNAIDFQKFAFQSAVREEVRRRFHLEGKFVVGHVGRFVFQKNHTFLIDIFAEVHRRNPDSVLFLLGDGPLLEKTREKVHALSLDSSVFFMGNRDDVQDFYQAFDIMLLPSHYEGFPLSLAEAQASGLEIFCSDAITPEICLSDHLHFISLRENSASWAEKILQSPHPASDRTQIHLDRTYDISNAALEFEKTYEQILCEA